MLSAYFSTASHDGNLLAWTPKRTAVDDIDDDGGQEEEEEGGGAGGGGVLRRKRGRVNADAWSDDEDPEDRRGPRLLYR